MWTPQRVIAVAFFLAVVCLAGCATAPDAGPESAPASSPSTVASAPSESPHGPALDAPTLKACAVPLDGASAVTSAELEAHVRALSSDQMEGRGVGTEGLDRAADYIATGFASAGLTPAGEEAFMQPFDVTVGAVLGAPEEQHLTIGAETFEFGKQWRPFAFSQTGEVTAKLAFVGYGVRAPDLNYDDYQGIDVAGRVVVVLRHRPARHREGSPFASKDAARFADLRYKAFAARSMGAVGLIVVNDPATYADADDDVPYTFGSGSEGHIPAVHLTWRDGGARLAAIGLDLAAAQRGIDEKPAPASRLLDVEATLRVGIQRSRARVRNVVGLLLPEGMQDPAEADEVIVVGAHYDHLGRGGEGSLAPDSKEVHNGADDNASGTAMLMELAQALGSRRASLRRPIYFVAFTGEEIGLRGSEHWVTHAPVEPERIAAMVNFDMVGRLRGDKLYVGGVGTAVEFERLVEEASAGQGLKIAVGRDGFGPSDHSAFYGRKIPVLFLFTGAHDEYHTPSDDADLVNFAGMATVGAFAFRAIYYLAASPSRPFYTQADRRREGDSGGAGGRGYGAYLGTVPSFAEYEGEGVVLQGVRGGSPAELAGIRGGDILVGMDDRAIDDLYEFTYALRERKTGDRVVVKVLRDGKELSFEAVLGERKK